MFTGLLEAKLMKSHHLPLLFSILLFCLPASLVCAPQNAPQKKDLQGSLKLIRYLVIDVDSVLTDGGLYYASSGEALKRFHVLDNVGIDLLHKAEIEVVLVSLDNSPITKTWAEERGIEQMMLGLQSKEEVIRDLARHMIITPNRIAYLGGDIDDLPAMKKAGVSACPSGAPDAVKAACSYVSSTPAGAGVVREFAELLLRAQGKREGAP